MAKTIVITGSTRGLGFEMAKVFLNNGCNVVINGRSEESVSKACSRIEELCENGARVGSFVCDVTDRDGLENMWDFAVKEFENVDIWINNAGVNQPDKAIWELDASDIDRIIDVDLRGAIHGSTVAVNGMKKQGHGAVYNIEGHGSNDNVIKGLSIYGTSKRAITYFTSALAKEVSESGLDIIVGRLSPGIMITDFITGSLGDKNSIRLSEKTKKVYNILGDYPDVVAKFLVEGILKNKKNDVKIEWLTSGKAARRFMLAAFNSRDFFNQKDI